MRLKIAWVVLILMLSAACQSSSNQPVSKPTPGPLPTLKAVTWQQPSEVITVDNANKIKEIGAITNQDATINAIVFSHSGSSFLGIDGSYKTYGYTLANGLSYPYNLSDTTFTFFSADDTILASTTNESGVRFLDSATGKVLGSAVANPNGITVAAMSPDSSIMATGGLNGDIMLWNVQGRVLFKTIPPVPNSGLITGLAFSPDGKMLTAIAVNDPKVHLWKIPTGDEITALGSLTALPQTIIFSPDGTDLAVGTSLGIVDFDMKTFQVVWNLETSDVVPLKGMSFSPNHKMLAISGLHDFDYVLDPTNGKVLASLPNHNNAASGLAFSPNSQLLITTTQLAKPGAYVWATESFVPGASTYTRAAIGQDSNGFFGVSWLPNGTGFILYDLSGGMMVWGIPHG